MPAYVDDPENPGKKIDVVELQRRDPHKALPPVSVRHWLRRELWTRREAIKLLSGYEPDGTPWSESDEGFSNIPTGQITYLDGLMAHWLSDAGLYHPLSDACLENFMVLAAYSKWSSLDERRTPREWIDWAASKDFRPYWLDWAFAQGLLPEEQTAGRRKTPPLKVAAQTDVVALPTAVPGAKTANVGNPHKPEWSVWRHAMKASLRDAVCLSCDTNPRAVPKDLSEMFVAELIPQISASKEVRGEISYRLQIAESHAGTGGTLPTVTGGKDGEVYLATFAEWALNTMKWTVPDELQALADNASPTEVPASPEVGVVRYSTITRVTPLSAEIEEAKKRAPDPDNVESVWGEFTKMAEQEWGILVGYSSDGVQFRGRKYEESGVPDVFTKKNLRDRIGGARRRATQRDKAR